MRSAAVSAGAQRAGLGAALLMAQGTPAWMRGWRACVPAAGPRPADPRPAPSEVVAVLAAMALACT